MQVWTQRNRSVYDNTRTAFRKRTMWTGSQSISILSYDHCLSFEMFESKQETGNLSQNMTFLKGFPLLSLILCNEIVYWG